MISLRRSHSRRGLPWLALTAIAAAAAVGLPATAAGKKPASKRNKVVGVVYSQTNDVNANAVVEFDRLANGQLKPRGQILTGGKGGLESQHGCGDNCPFLDTQGELTLSANGRLLFVVNAGSNTVSSFRVTSHGLKLADQRSSSGTFPYSVTSHGHLLYVLNEKSLNISGFRVSTKGKLTPIAGSTRPLSSGAMSGATGPRQIAFDNTGRVLAVTLLGANQIDTFVLNANGTPGNATAHPSTSPLPFGFAFDRHNHMVVSQVHDLTGTPTGDTATYNVTGSGLVTAIDTKGSNGFAPCWLAVTSTGRYVYVVNTGAGAPSGATVSVYSLTARGKLTLIQVTPQVVVDPGPPVKTEFAMTDDAVSRDNRYLYVVAPGVFAPSKIYVWKIGRDGRLALIGGTARNLAPGLSGVVAR